MTSTHRADSTESLDVFTTAARPTLSFHTAWLTESVRHIEAEGPLEDSAALRQAAQQGGTREAQVVTRAELLAQRLDLSAQIKRVGRLGPWSVLALVLLVVLVGLGLAGTVVDAADRRINVMGALVALLGAHVVTLVLWLMALIWPGLAAAGANPFGQLWWSLTARLGLGRGAEATALTSALMGLLTRARLLPWLFGLVSHLVWTLAFGVALIALLFALSFRHYTLGWETTLFDPSVFVGWVQALAVVPGWLGFAVPDPQSPTNQELAGWLIGCLIVYGLMPRALLAVLSAMMLRIGRKRIAPDWAAPYYRQLFARLDALMPATVVDADTHANDPRPDRGGAPRETADALVVAGFELPPETVWPPTGLPEGAEPIQVDGSALQRAALLDRLTRARPRLLVLVCHPASSPDRGTERLLREALSLVGECRLWLPDAAPGEAGRWQAWLRAIGLEDLRCVTDASAAFAETATR